MYKTYKIPYEDKFICQYYVQLFTSITYNQK